MGRHLLTDLEYEQLLAAQHGRCSICTTQPEPGERRLAVDHDHTTGAVRGLLCTRCNLGLGYFADNPTHLTAAIGYLAGHRIQMLPADQQHELLDGCENCYGNPDAPNLGCHLPTHVRADGFTRYHCERCDHHWTCWWNPDHVAHGIPGVQAPGPEEPLQTARRASAPPQEPDRETAGQSVAARRGPRRAPKTPEIQTPGVNLAKPQVRAGVTPGVPCVHPQACPPPLLEGGRDVRLAPTHDHLLAERTPTT